MKALGVQKMQRVQPQQLELRKVAENRVARGESDLPSPEAHQSPIEEPGSRVIGK
jgi:hypothetical protein